jgi:sugar phosphate isomerase/epimerase
MRPIGFSSGALAKSDFRKGVALQESAAFTAVELSALREPELEPLVDAAEHLPLGHFEYVSFHAPSAFRTLDERQVVALLSRLPREWPVVVHPDLIHEPEIWATLGSRLCLENMDMRKRTGRTVEEMRAVFAALPRAGFCLDLGHARQIDPTMGIAIEMLQAFGPRLRQLHVSEVGTFGDHRRLGFLARTAFRRVIRYVPSDVPVILESIVAEADMMAEFQIAKEIFAA